MSTLLLVMLFFFTPVAEANSLEALPAAVSEEALLEEDAEDAASELPERQLSDAYSSLYATDDARRRNEREALGMAILGGIVGWLGGGVGSLITFGIGSLALPGVVAFGAAYAIQPYFDTRLGWEIAGGLIGLGTGAVLAWSAGFFAGVTRGSGLRAGTILFGVTALTIAPGIGAWLAGITDQDNLERRRIALSLAALPRSSQTGPAATPGLAMKVSF